MGFLNKIKSYIDENIIGPPLEERLLVKLKKLEELKDDDFVDVNGDRDINLSDITSDYPETVFMVSTIKNQIERQLASIKYDQDVERRTYRMSDLEGDN